jgi:hypothetical protein
LVAGFRTVCFDLETDLRAAVLVDREAFFAGFAVDFRADLPDGRRTAGFFAAGLVARGFRAGDFLATDFLAAPAVTADFFAPNFAAPGFAAVSFPAAGLPAAGFPRADLLAGGFSAAPAAPASRRAFSSRRVFSSTSPSASMERKIPN